MHITIKQVKSKEEEENVIDFLHYIFGGEKKNFFNTYDSPRFYAKHNGVIIGALGYYYLTRGKFKLVSEKDYLLGNEVDSFLVDKFYCEKFEGGPILDWGGTLEGYRNINVFTTLLFFTELHAYKAGFKKMIAGTIIPEFFKKRKYIVVEEKTIQSDITTAIKDLNYLKHVG